MSSSERLTMGSGRFLTEGQAEEFLERGFVVVRECFPREVAEAWTEEAFGRLGCRADEPGTWKETRVHLPAEQRVPFREFAPRAWGAACELLGGEGRVSAGNSVGDDFIINFRFGANRVWRPPSAAAMGWHKDGDWFRHFLDSREQGLLTLMAWSDLEPKSGGTFLACDSVGVVARYLAERPEGVRPGRLWSDTRALIAECREFVEFTGQVGDVALLHPFMLHAASQNPSGRPRFLTNPPIVLKQPMRFNRRRGDYSLVERAVLRGLGVESFDFVRTGPRERLTPARVKRQRKMRREERARK